MFACPPCKYNNAAIYSSTHKWRGSIKGVTEVLTGDDNELGVMKTVGTAQLGATFNGGGCDWMWIILTDKEMRPQHNREAGGEV